MSRLPVEYRPIARYALWLICLVRGHRWKPSADVGYVDDMLCNRVECSRCGMFKFTRAEPPK